MLAAGPRGNAGAGAAARDRRQSDDLSPSLFRQAAVAPVPRAAAPRTRQLPAPWRFKWRLCPSTSDNYPRSQRPIPTREERLIDQAVATGCAADPTHAAPGTGSESVTALLGSIEDDLRALSGNDHLLLLQPRGAPCQLAPGAERRRAHHRVRLQRVGGGVAYLARLSPRGLAHQQPFTTTCQIEPAPR